MRASVTTCKGSTKSILLVRQEQAPTPLRCAVVIPAYEPDENILVSPLKIALKYRKIKEFSDWYRMIMRNTESAERPPCLKCEDIELWMCQKSGYECEGFKKYANLDREW